MSDPRPPRGSTPTGIVKKWVGSVGSGRAGLKELVSRPTVRGLGVVGAVVGAATAGIAVERAAMRRARAAAGDRHAGERFGALPYDRSCTVRTADGTDLYVELVEPTAATGPTVVFVHGFCLDMGSFHFQRTALTARGAHRVVCYDQPGHGRSGRLESGEYELPALGEALHTVLERTVPEGPLVLVGHSMGGMTIMAFAERYPEMFGDRVAGTVLMATSGGLIAETSFGLHALIGRFGAPLLPLACRTTRLTGVLLDQARRASADLAWLLTRRYGFGGARPSPALVSYVRLMNARTSTETIARYLRTLYTHARYPALAALRGTPVLVIVGEKDVITPVAHSEEILRHLPHAEFVKVPDGGHVVMLEYADEVNAALLDFLDRLPK